MINRATLLSAAIALVLCLGTRHANAGNITFVDFEDQPLSSALSSLSVANGGITYTITRGGESLSIADLSSGSGTVAFGSRSLIPGGPDSTTPYLISFSKPINSFSLQVGDFGDDLDSLSMSAFASADGSGPALLSTSDSLVPIGNQFSSKTLLIETPGMNSIRLNADTLAIDNLSAAVVPLPPAVWMALGTGAMAVIARKRMTRQTA